MSDLDQALKEAYARSRTSTRQLVALEMLHYTFPGEGILLVNYDSDITLDNKLYSGIGMEAAEPESGTEPDDKVTIRLDGVTGEMQYWINSAIVTSSNITVFMRPFAFNTQTESIIGTVGAYEFLLLKAQYNEQTVVLELGHVSPTNQPFPGVKYTPENSPELFR